MIMAVYIADLQGFSVPGLLGKNIEIYTCSIIPSDQIISKLITAESNSNKTFR